MAHFAKINEENIVEYIMKVDNKDINNLDFPESEPIGAQFLLDIGFEGNWKQTSYNNNFRRRYAAIGYTYDSENDVFLEIRPYASWVLDENYDWQPPIPMPETGGPWTWNEELQDWEEQISS